jgi:hypothetical protein
MSWKLVALFSSSILLIVGLRGTPSSFPEVWDPNNRTRFPEAPMIEEGYNRVVIRLYGTLYDALVTPPYEDEVAATQKFEKGLAAARKAKVIALKSAESQ